MSDASPNTPRDSPDTPQSNLFCFFAEEEFDSFPRDLQNMIRDMVRAEPPKDLSLYLSVVDRFLKSQERFVEKRFQEFTASLLDLFYTKRNGPPFGDES